MGLLKVQSGLNPAKHGVYRAPDTLALKLVSDPGNQTFHDGFSTVDILASAA
jgi:hypothetical protein